MFGDPTVRYTILGVLLVLLALPGCRRPPSPEELAQQALQAATPEQQQAAATQLAARGQEARPQLRRVLAESQTPLVRAACIHGLVVQWDYESMPALLDALEDQSAMVRGRAGMAVQRMLSVDFKYGHDDPPAKRAATVKRLRKKWEEMRDSAILKRWKQRLEEPA